MNERYSVFALLCTLLVTHGSLSAEDDAKEGAKSEAGWPFRWVTSLDVGGDSVYAGSANGLLLRESTVVKFSDAEPAKSVSLYNHPVSVWAVALSPDGSTLASTDYKGNLSTYNIADRNHEVKEGVFERWTRAIAWVADGKHIVAGNEAGKVFVYNVGEGKSTKSQELDGQQIYDIAIAPDGNSVAIGDGAGHVHLLKYPSLESIKEVKCGESPAWAVEYAADGKSVYAGGADRSIRFFEVEGETEPKEIGKAKDWITAMDRNDSGQIAVGTMNGEVMIVAGTKVETIGKTPSGIWSLGCSGDRLLIGTRKHMVSVFEQIMVPTWKLGYAAPDEGK